MLGDPKDSEQTRMFVDSENERREKNVWAGPSSLAQSPDLRTPNVQGSSSDQEYTRERADTVGS